MKLKDKKTGEIKPAEAREDGIYLYDEITEQWYKYELSLLAEYWEYYEEQKEYWFINSCGVVEVRNEEEQLAVADMHKQFGNYFETKEEAEEAVEKLKAWKRLKGGGFEFISCSYGHNKTTDDTGGWIGFRVNHLYDDRYSCEVEKDLDLLFGGKE